MRAGGDAVPARLPRKRRPGGPGHRPPALRPAAFNGWTRTDEGLAKAARTVGFAPCPRPEVRLPEACAGGGNAVRREGRDGAPGGARVPQMERGKTEDWCATRRSIPSVFPGETKEGRLSRGRKEYGRIGAPAFIRTARRIRPRCLTIES